MCERHVFTNAELHQRPYAGLDTIPTGPDTHPDSAADPFVQLAKETLDWHQSEVSDPAMEVTTKFDATMRKRNASIATSDLAGTRFELVEVLLGDANLATVALEDKAEKLDSVGATNAALLSIDNQLEFSRQVMLDRLEHTARCLSRLGEHKKSSSPGELHPQALTEPDVSLSAHPAPIVQAQVEFRETTVRTDRVLDGPRGPANAPLFAGGYESV